VIRALAALVALIVPSFAVAQPLQTVAEKSGYKATSKHADVVAFCEAVAKRGPVAKLDYFGTTHEGRKLPVLVVADPPVATPAEAKRSGKLVVLAFANIHAGEVDGKEALLALARELTDKKEHPLLKDLVILLVPNLNADGNEKFGNHRPDQNGPAEVGTRENAQGLDLNRDFVKLEAPEVRALVNLVNEWDPALIIDCHTTDGSPHRHTLTYDGPRYPSTETDISKWSRATLFPEVAKKVKAAAGFDIAPYGNFNKERTKWETYPATPRYGVQYFALRGKVGVLSESYTHAPFKDRVAATKAFVTACFEVAAGHKKELAKLTAPVTGGSVALGTSTHGFAERIDILGFEEVEKDGKRVVTDRPKGYSVQFLALVEPRDLVPLPEAYLVPAEATAVVETLRRHGVAVEELREDIDLATDTFGVQRVDVREAGFPKKYRLTQAVGGWSAAGTGRVAAGTVVVKTAQPLGRLAAYLLEPFAEDGLTTWGLFGDAVQVGKPHPVRRVPKLVPMALGAVRPLSETVAAKHPVTEAVLQDRRGGFTFGFAGTPVATGAWLDAEHFLQVKGGKLLKVEARTGKGEPFADPQRIQQSLAALKDLNIKTAEKFSRATSFRTNPDRSAFLFDMEADLGLAYFDGRPAVRLTKSGGTKEYVSFSPDGKRVAFVRGNNLFAVGVATQKEVQLTSDGGADVFNGKGDWVYEEEIFNRNGKAYWWSPDGARIAFLHFDDGPVKKFNLVDLMTPRGKLESYAYPKPGDPNPLVKLGVVAADGGAATYLDFGDYKPDDTLVSRVGWVAKSNAVFAYVQNRTQTWLDFVVWDAPGAKPRKLFRTS
jgi:hypothetical protein